MSSALIGKRIEYHVESTAGPGAPAVADVKPGRHEGEVILVPVPAEPTAEQPNPPVPRPFYQLVSALFIRRVLTPPPGPPAAEPAPPVEIEFVPPEEEPPDAGAAPELTDERRLSQSPIAPAERRKRGRGAPADHGTAAAQPDEFQPKEG